MQREGNSRAITVHPRATSAAQRVPVCVPPSKSFQHLSARWVHVRSTLGATLGEGKRCTLGASLVVLLCARHCLLRHAFDCPQEQCACTFIACCVGNLRDCRDQAQCLYRFNHCRTMTTASAATPLPMTSHCRTISLAGTSRMIAHARANQSKPTRCPNDLWFVCIVHV